MIHDTTRSLAQYIYRLFISYERTESYMVPELTYAGTDASLRFPFPSSIKQYERAD